MKLPLVGPSNVLGSTAAAASECTNLYPEVIEDPEDRTKNVAVLRKRAGGHTVIDLGAAAGGIRGLFTCESPSGGGRLFAVCGDTLYEVGQNTYLTGPPTTGVGNVINSWVLPGINDTQPVQMFGNGTQLGIVANGYFYYSNGAAPLQARFQVEGILTVAGLNVTWASGDKFTAAMNGRTINVNGEFRTFTFGTATTGTVSAGIAGGVSGTGQHSYDGAFIAATGVFTADMVGKQILINGLTYTVWSFTDSNTIFLNPPVMTPSAVFAWSIVSANIPFSCDGGPLVTAITGAYMGSCAFVNRPHGGAPDQGRQVAYSEPGDFITWRAENFFEKQGNPDYIKSIYSDRELLYLLGDSESEIWQIDPSTGNPVRLPSGVSKQGSALTWAPAHVADTLFFVGGTPLGGLVAYRLNGFAPVRISTPAVEQAWGSYTTSPSGATGYGLINRTGHQFWVINFPVPGFSWAYDVTASDQLGYPVWHRLAGWDTPGATFYAYPYWHHAFSQQWTGAPIAKGIHFVGGPFSGRIYEQNEDFGDDNAQDIHWRRAVPAQYNAGNRVFYGRMTLEAEMGAVPSGAAPVVTRDNSDDRGHTFTNSRTVNLGVHADYTHRAYWQRNGSGRYRIWRFTGSGQELVTLIDLQVEEAEGRT